MPKAARNLQRSTLQKLAAKSSNKLIPLRIEYSEKSKLLTGYINKLVNTTRIYPRHLPTQASFRWSTFEPPLTNFPRACVEPTCQEALRQLPDYQDWIGYIEHETTPQCWSVRDILAADDDEVMISFDHDNIEGKIHDLIVNDQEGIKAHQEGYDLHTITCCNIFAMDYPSNLKNPHSSSEDAEWRTKYNWQGKDTKQRVLAKNFNHGSKYTKTWRFVYRIEDIEKYGVSRDSLGQLARRYIDSKKEAWQRKLAIMAHIQRARISRTLYGGRRVFFDSSEETGREGFSHQVSGTVSDYNNHTLILFERLLGDAVRLGHNAHDGDKLFIKKDSVPSMDELRQIIERPIEYNGKQLIMTAGIKIHG